MSPLSEADGLAERVSRSSVREVRAGGWLAGRCLRKRGDPRVFDWIEFIFNFKIFKKVQYGTPVS